MVENIVSSYKCPFCGGKDISEKNIDIIWAAWNTVNIDMHCPSCKKHFMAKTEVMHMDLWPVNAQKLEQIQKSLSALKGRLGWNIEIDQSDLEASINATQIKDEDITEIRNTLKKRYSKVEDLFTDSENND
jgi:rubredoxin